MGLFRKREPVEVRDPTAATKSLRYLSPGQPQAPDWDAARAFELAYYLNVVIYSCAQLYANTVSGLEFRAGADPSKPNDYDPKSPLALLLGPPPGGPAPDLSARRLWAWTVKQRLITGRNGWEIESDGTRPVALWPLASSSLTPIPSQSGVEWFTGFTYGRRDNLRTLKREQVVYDWDPSGRDFRQPESALQAANLDISVSVMQSRYDYAFLKNDARPSAVVVTEEFEDEDNFIAWKNQWNTEFGGPNNAGKMAFLEATGGPDGVKGAVDVTVLGISPKDAQAAQRHQAAMLRCAMALGVPWSLLDASGRTFDNAGQEWRNWTATRLVPMLNDFADMVNMQLAPQLGTLVGWFDLTPLNLDDAVTPVTQPATAPVLVQAQLMTINEARADYGLPPLPGGDRVMTPDEIMALQGAGFPVPAPTQVAAAPVEIRVPPDVVAPVDPPPPGPNHEARRARIWSTTNGRVLNLERQWQRQLRKLFARQARATLLRLEGKRSRQLVTEARQLADEVFDPFHWLSETEDDVTGLYEAVTAAGGARVSDLFGLAFDLEAPYAQNFVKARANQLAGRVTETTYTAIQDALAEGVGLGEGIPDLAARVREVFDVASRTRAETIARTEVVSAFNGAATMTATELGADVVAGQEWIATQDSRTRDSHSEIDGEIIDVNDTFSNGLLYPGDPNGEPAEVVNCRCTIAFLTPDEMGERSGGRSRFVPHRVARSVIEMIPLGGFDEHAVRRALVAA